MGHSTQAISILARATNTLFAVPLDIQFHEGVIFSNRDKRTLLDKLVSLVAGLGLAQSCYLVADAYVCQRQDHQVDSGTGARSSDASLLG